VPVALRRDDVARPTWWGTAGPDVAVALVLVALTVVQLVLDPPRAATAGLLTGVLSVLPLMARTRAPLLAALGVSGGVAGHLLLVGGDPPFAAFLAITLATYSLARHARPLAAAVGLAAIVAAVVGVAVAYPGPPTGFDLVPPVAYLGGAAVTGYVVRQRSVRQQADLRLAAADERARVARELHDVVAHGVSLMVVHAEAADAVLDSDPAAARRSLRQAAETGRASVAELRRLLDLLRVTDPEEGREVAPAPSLDQVEQLADHARSAGLVVTLVRNDPSAELPPGVQLTAYRVVQEALTNVVKHASATRVDVQIDYSATDLTIVVQDDGRGGGAVSGAGHGLAGMAERVAVYSGTLEAGSGPEGGFRLVARLSVTAAQAAEGVSP